MAMGGDDDSGSGRTDGVPGQTGEEVTLAGEASRFRAVLLEGSRSSTLTNLFDFLLERADDDRSPKEIEIAMEVFGKTGAFDTSQDSMVRSHIHRLRQRLDKFNEDRTGPRLTIPRGEYRLVLSDAPDDMDDADEIEDEAAGPEHERWRWPANWPLTRVLAVVVALNVAFWTLAFLFAHQAVVPSPLARTALWKPVVETDRSPVIAVGDFYMVAQSGDEGIMERLALNPAIQSEAELANYLMRHPAQQGKLHARDIYRVPASVAESALTLQTRLSAMRPGAEPAVVTPVTRMSQDRIDASNIVYVQYFSQLAMLRSPILHMSGFAATTDFNELRDVASGKVYRVRHGEAASGDGPGSYGVDYGYIAAFSGAGGSRNVFISGLSDVGLEQMVKIVSDTAALDALAERTGKASSFEALYRVRTAGGLVFDTELLIARPLGSGGRASARAGAEPAG